jgi:uncharacterized protein (DUF488 family)
MNESATLRVYTIGHSNYPREGFLDRKRFQAIEVLVGTRSLPHSRFAPHFKHGALQPSLIPAGFPYLYLGGELGGGRHGYQLCDAPGRVWYHRLASSTLFKEGLARLLAGIRAYKVALFCAEESPRLCHRPHIRLFAEAGHRA